MLRLISIAILAFIVAACERAATHNAACTTCDIELERIAEISDAFDPGVLPELFVYADRDARGRIYATSKRRDGLFVFDKDGKFLQRLGTTGDGPGEFRLVRRVFIGAGDSIVVSDWSLRVHIFTPELLFARTQTVAGFPALLLPNGEFVVAEPLGAPGRVGYPLHHVLADGSYGKSFGTDTLQSGADVKLFATRLIANADSGGIWTVAPGRYVIERWNPTLGTRAKSLPVKSAWFKELARWPADERVRPPAIIEALHDDDGVLWVLFRVADLEWKAPGQPNEERLVSTEEYEATFDWIVEAVDPITGDVMASKRFKQALVGRPPSRVFVSVRRSASEHAGFDVWRPVLRRGTGNSR